MTVARTFDFSLLVKWVRLTLSACVETSTRSEGTRAIRFGLGLQQPRQTVAAAARSQVGTSAHPAV
jgi:hypothetical protein